jgi:hypothetical protein
LAAPYLRKYPRTTPELDCRFSQLRGAGSFFRDRHAMAQAGPVPSKYHTPATSALGTRMFRAPITDVGPLLRPGPKAERSLLDLR